MTDASSSSNITIDLRNVVCTFDLGVTVNCCVVAQLLSARYDNKCFPACVHYDQKYHTSAQIFGTGRVVIVGARRAPIGQLAAQNLASALQAAGMQTRLYNFHVTNSVCNIDTNTKIDLQKMYRKLQYMPEVVDAKQRVAMLKSDQFPGMSFAIASPAITKLTREARYHEVYHYELTHDTPNRHELAQAAAERVEPVVTTITMFATGRGVSTGMTNTETGIPEVKAFLEKYIHEFAITTSNLN